MDEITFPRIDAVTKLKETWDILFSSFQGINGVKLMQLQMLRRELKNLQMSESKSLNDFLTHSMKSVNYMKINGENLENQKHYGENVKKITI